MLKVASIAIASLVTTQAVAGDYLPQLREELSNKLLDYNSAIIKDVKVDNGTDGSFYVCGRVNSKNTLGGYVGFRPFYGFGGTSASDGKVHLIFGDGGMLNMVPDEMCSDSKHSWKAITFKK